MDVWIGFSLCGPGFSNKNNLSSINGNDIITQFFMVILLIEADARIDIIFSLMIKMKRGEKVTDKIKKLIYTWCLLYWTFVYVYFNAIFLPVRKT